MKPHELVSYRGQVGTVVHRYPSGAVEIEFQNGSVMTLEQGDVVSLKSKTKEKFTRDVTFTGAYDKRNPNPKKNYGIHGVSIRFVLRGKLGATQFVLYTDWFLPHVQRELRAKGDDNPLSESIQPMGVDIGYHSPKPMYENQLSMECDVLGGKCYYDGSGLRADEFIPQFLAGGSDTVWKMLEEEYAERFESK